ncbi:hypothetical protein [Azohydromonas aeria]|uniref:hypothetical protein n=1 Tax=Azohydromonas aeria TaxID=2590212 RepID=UPI0012F99301|nr:hypothetical protein [Azohydromonas aeria]
MPTLFNDETEGAGVGERGPVRALQAWQYLIARAANRQIVRYKELRDLMDYPNDNPLAGILGCVAYYCMQHDLPPLTVIVVNRHGEPGGGFPIPAGATIGQLREDVFEYPWFKLMPPTIDEFAEARRLARE